MAHRILLEKMGVENYSPKFLKVVQPAGLNKETNQAQETVPSMWDPLQHVILQLK